MIQQFIVISLLIASFQWCHSLTENKMIDFDFAPENNSNDLWRKRAFINQIENQREYDDLLAKRQRLARLRFEEHCEPRGKIRQRICPTVEQCYSVSPTSAPNTGDRFMEELFQRRAEANQFLRSLQMSKRFFVSSLITTHDDYDEKNIHERRRKGLLLYEEYCESTDRLPRACPSLDRCRCGDCGD